MAASDIGTLDMADLVRLLREAMKQILYLADEDGLDDESRTVRDLNALFGLMVDVEHRITPTYVRARDELPTEVAEWVDDAFLQDVLLALQRFTATLPAGPRPADEKTARAWRKTRNEHIDYDLLGYLRGPLAHAERHGEEHYLYLMRHGDWLKFGRGTFGRVRSYGPDIEIVQVLSGEFQDVKDGENSLKARFRNDSHPGPGVRLPRNFGRGTECIPATLPIDLTEVLPGGVDVTTVFVNSRAGLEADRTGPTRNPLQTGEADSEQ